MLPLILNGKEFFSIYALNAFQNINLFSKTLFKITLSCAKNAHKYSQNTFIFIYVRFFSSFHFSFRLPNIFFKNPNSNLPIICQSNMDNIAHVEPFQIFCLERRAEIVKQHPNLTSSKITSILGSLWRSTSPSLKQYYSDVASSVQLSRPRITKKKSQNKSQSSPVLMPSLSSSSGEEEDVIQSKPINVGKSSIQILSPPVNLFIVPRAKTSSAIAISEISFRKSMATPYAY